MTMRRRFPRRSARGPKRPTSWENLTFLHVHTAAANTVVSDLTPEPMQTTDEGVGTATIRRMIAHFDYFLSGTLVDPTIHTIFVGVVVVAEDAISGLVTPDPASDFNQDWYYWTSRPLKVVAQGGLAQISWDVDIRTQRRLRGGYGLILVTQSLIQSDATDLAISMRCLWSQP